MHTAILFLVFNRPDTTIRVFETIRQAKPPRLYVAADGPRKDKIGEKEKCEEVRSIIKQVDWDCEVKTLFRDNNLGCGKAVSQAITWFFENEEEGIILEDDCVPSFPFFSYCEYLLEKYRYDTRVWMVSGSCFEENITSLTEYDYLFTKYGNIWGWASWRRCWNHYDLLMKDYNLFIKNGGFKNIYSSKEAKCFTQMYDRLSKDKKLPSSTWDYQWFLTRLMNGLSIVPTLNLVENIGEYGAHYNGGSSLINKKASEKYNISTEPHFVMVNKRYENLHFYKYYYKSIYNKLLTNLLRKSSYVINRMLK